MRSEGQKKASLGTLPLPLCCAGRACVSISRVNHNDGVFASRETSVLGRFLSSGGHLRLWPLKTITLSFKVRVIIVWIFSYGYLVVSKNMASLVFNVSDLALPMNLEHKRPNR